MLGVLCTALVYTSLYVLVDLLWLALLGPDRFSWFPLAITILVFLASLVAVIRRRSPSLNDLQWDSATAVEKSPSQTGRPGKGGFMWNVNPLGPESMRSGVSILVGVFCFGPSLAATAVLSAAEDLRGKSEDD